MSQVSFCGKANDLPTLLSFFSGAGFLDLGFMQAGFNVVWTNEMNSSFARGAACGMAGISRYPTAIQNINSITDVGPNLIIREAFGHNVPRSFGVIGGPPCPDFSVAGKNRGRDGDQGRLSQIYVDRILDLHPTFFLFENVSGLLKTRRHRIFLDQLSAQLAGDYLVDMMLLNALDFGVPQDRRRIFLIGFQKAWVNRHYGRRGLNVNTHWFPWPVDERYINAKTRFVWPTTAPFQSEPEKPEGIPEELMVGTWIGDPEALSRLPNGTDVLTPRSAKLSNVEEGDVSRKSFKRLHRWRYSPTAAYGNNEVHLHPFEPRRLSVREALRLQTVPDEYCLPPDMSLTHKFKTIGNGVPVKLAKAVGMAIANFLRGETDGRLNI